MEQLANLIPSMAVSDVGDSRFTDPEVCCYISICHSSQMAKANAFHLVGRKFLSVATFSRSIFHILLLSAKKQMARIAAGWIVATVEYIVRMRIGMEIQEPCDSWSNIGNPINSDLSASIFESASNPRPAFIGRVLNYLFPESLSLLFC